MAIFPPRFQPNPYQFECDTEKHERCGGSVSCYKNGGTCRFTVCPCYAKRDEKGQIIMAKGEKEHE